MQFNRSHVWTVVAGVLSFGALFAAMGTLRPSWLDPPSPQPVSARVQHVAVQMGSKPAVPIAEAILGYLDMRDGKPTLYGKPDSRLQVGGWTACSVPGSTLSRVIILVDGVERGEATEFFARPDVAAAFGRPDFEMSGWRATISLAGLKPGQHTLSAQGIGSHGEKGTLPAFHLNILE